MARLGQHHSFSGHWHTSEPTPAETSPGRPRCASRQIRPPRFRETMDHPGDKAHCYHQHPEVQRQAPPGSGGLLLSGHHRRDNLAHSALADQRRQPVTLERHLALWPFPHLTWSDMLATHQLKILQPGWRWTAAPPSTSPTPATTGCSNYRPGKQPTSQVISRSRTPSKKRNRVGGA